MDWDTTGVFGPNRNNGLQTPLGHKFDDDAMKNPGATAIATGVRSLFETGRFLPDYTSSFPIWAIHRGAL